MVLILAGNPHQLRTLGEIFYLLRHIIISRAITTRIFFLKGPIHLLALATCSELPSDISGITISFILAKSI